MSLTIITPEESLEMQRRLAEEITAALTELDPKSRYPKHYKLYNALIHIMDLWREVKP